MNVVATSHTTTAKGHIPALDGMRGLAILLVLIHHTSYEIQCSNALAGWIKNIAFGGWTGVDLFFVLSGFLITGILWDTKESVHYFRNFYARRTLRIFPLYYAALIFLLFVIPSLVPLIVHGPMRLRVVLQGQIDLFAAATPYWPLFFTYLVNVLVAWKGFTIFLLHFWSLSVEEHFYLAWPLLVYRLQLRSLIIVSASLVVAAFLFRVAALMFVDGPTIYVLTPFRMDGLALGALLALLWRTPEQRAQLIYWARRVLPIAGFSLLTVLCYKGVGSQYGRLSQSVGYSASILFYGALLVMVLHVEPLNAVFRHKFWRFFGKYSYSIYIFHVLPMYLATHLFAAGDPLRPSVLVRVLKRLTHNPDLSPNGFLLCLDALAFVTFVIGASAVIAMITWRLLEAPCLRFKRFFSYEEHGRPVEGTQIVADLVRR